MYINKIHKEINNYLCKYKGIKEIFYPRIKITMYI